MLKPITFLIAVLVAQVFGNILDLFDQTEHEPRVAIYCGHVPFHMDLKTGKWVSDQTGINKCDTNKQDVKRYCQKIYPKLNISNIVEANEKVTIGNWCTDVSKKCNIEKRVVPYRCLVDDYEADALMVPKDCKFNHLHDEASCMTHDEWKARAAAFCKKDDMKLNEYGILLSCGTDMFTGVEFVCCPHEHKMKPKPEIRRRKPVVDRVGLESAVKELEKYMPEQTEGCDRTMYEAKRQKLEESHRSKIAAVVDEWDEAETRYKKMNLINPKEAQDKMNKTLHVFRETLAALEQEAKEARDRLKVEHANCIQVNINKHKRDSMLAYLLAVQEKPHTIKHILRTARKFFQDCEHDRLHSLRHFQHVRKQRPEEVEKLRKELLTHLQQLNEVVNKSIALLSYLPDVAEKFGLQKIFELTPTEVPELIRTEGPTPSAPEEVVTEEPTNNRLPVDTFLEEEEPATKMPTTGFVAMEEPVTKRQRWDLRKKMQEGILKLIKKMEDPEKEHHDKEAKEDHYPNNLRKFEREEPMKKEPTTEEPTTEKPTTEKPTTEKPITKEPATEEPATEEPATEEPSREEPSREELDIDNSSKERFAKGTLNPTDMPPKTRFDTETSPDADGEGKTGKITLGKGKGKKHNHSFFKHPKSPAAFAAVIGLSCGALVIMLGIIVALVMRRNRANQVRLLVQDAGPEDQEHLVKMQKSGYENPTYKFFYY